MSHIDGEAAFNTIRQKIHSGTTLEDDDLMKLVIPPLTVPDSKGKQEMLEKLWIWQSRYQMRNNGFLPLPA